jgi:hypothetical protein
MHRFFYFFSDRRQLVSLRHFAEIYFRTGDAGTVPGHAILSAGNPSFRLFPQARESRGETAPLTPYGMKRQN